MRRRRFLARVAAPAALVGVGCVNAPSRSTPTPTPTPGRCDGFEPHPVDVAGDDLVGHWNGFELTASRGVAPMGEDVAIRLRNTTREERTTGNETMYAIQRATVDGWQHVLAAPENWTWTEEALLHPPCEGFTWRLSLTREGIAQDPYRACEALAPGTYRFVYFGVTSGTAALAVQFAAGRETEFEVVDGYEAHTFDHAGLDAPVLEGGLAYEAEPYASRHHVAVVTAGGDAGPFDRETLRTVAPDAASFVEGTDFATQYLVAFQAFPASSSPDYRVEEVVRLADGIHLRVTDESAGGTSDITVETLLVRLPRAGRGAPRFATVRTEDDRTYSTL